MKLSTNKKKPVETFVSRPKPRKNEKTQRFPAVSNRQAVDQVIQKLAELGRLEDVDVALLNLARAAATLVDDQPTPSAVKEYAAILTKMMTIGKEADNDFADLIDQLRTKDSNA